VKCPRCGNNPHAERVPPIVWRIVAVLVGVGLLVCIGWVIFRALTTNGLTNMLGLNQPTPAPTQVIQVIYVVATPVPPTATTTPSSTPTKIVSPTAIPRGAKPAPTVVPPTVIPPGFYPAVVLNTPANATVYAGANAAIVLEWQAVAPGSLKENEWYEIQLTFTGRDSKPAERKSYTKETRWILSPDLYKEISLTVRTIKWTVNVVRVEGFDPLAALNRTPITVGSSSRTFIWNP